MPKPRVLALSLLPLVTVACPTETNMRPPSHQAASRAAKSAEKSGAGVAAIVAEAAEQAKAQREPTGAEEAKVPAKAVPPKAAPPKAAPTPPAEGDIPAPPDVAAAPADTRKTSSGLAYKVMSKGTGTKKPREFDKVEVHYSGWTTDGKMFDSSRKRGRPASFAVNRVIKGWTEGLQLMVEGDQMRFWIPADLAYGTQPGRPQGMLVFDVELLGITEGTPPIPAPPDVAAPPADASKTASGIAYKVLTKGTGADHPSETSKVEVHYTGWTTDGKMFDSSVTRGKSTSFGLNRVIKGWTEGVQLMVVGEKTRFWIPEELAYGGRPGKPAGMLVFDIELLSVE